MFASHPVLKDAAALLAGLCIAQSLCNAQATVSGQTAAYFYKSAPTESQRALGNGRPSFGWQMDLFGDARISDNVAALATVRVSDDQSINFDYVAIRATGLTPLGLNVQAGKFDLPFGNLGDRLYPRRNPLFSLPLVYSYRTALPDQPVTEAALTASRGKGTGMRLLDSGMYGVGAMAFGSVGILEYAVAVTTGTISTTSYGTENANSDLAPMVRLVVTPFTGFTVGAAYTQGAYLEESYTTPRNIDVNSYRQQAAELDVSFSRGYTVLSGEVVYNRWPVPLADRDENFNVLGYYVEGKYTIIPRLYAALRVSGLNFGNVLLGGSVSPWDYNVTEWEGGAGFFLDRDVLLKLVRRETRIYGGSDPKDNLTALQLVVAY